MERDGAVPCNFNNRTPATACDGPGAWPTEWSVSVDERRDKQPASEPGAQPPALPAPGLSPVQEAQRARVDHTKCCRQCADIDRQRCPIGERLWQAWTVALDDAYRRLHGNTA